MVLWVPMYALAMISTKLVSQNTRGLIYSDLIVTIQSFALTEAFLKDMIKTPTTFEITDKNKPFRLKHFSKSGLPHLIYFIFSVIALVVYLFQGVPYWIVMF